MIKGFFDIKNINYPLSNFSTTLFRILFPSLWRPCMVPHFVINFSDYKIVLSVSLQRVGTKFDL